MITIGLIGPIAAGKSVVLDEFRRLGAAVIEADRVSRELLAPGSDLLERVIAEFGREFLDARGRLKRKRLADLIFGDREARVRLEEIVHPAMVARMADEIAALREAPEPPPAVAIEAANLIEMGALGLVDVTVLVTAPRHIRLRRLMERDGVTREQARERLRLHQELGLENHQADYEIHAIETEDRTRRRAQQVWREAVEEKRTESGASDRISTG